ncbi:hypothetical protein CVT26_011341 [Gymnopilus dilepis]|uniref:Uncharacterized protein n=1 Tax=Gymnopilus dilepis TaxID=231916 RepID=A0A409W8W5_9AGAR|nr:hypothetical protein CVT26_011341 [Gymnopilus dilepis]
MHVSQDGYIEQYPEPGQSSTNNFLGNWNNFPVISDDVELDTDRNNLYVLPSTATEQRDTFPPSNHPTSATIALPIVSPLPLYDDGLDNLSGGRIHVAQQFHVPASSSTSPANALGLYFDIQTSDPEPPHYLSELSRAVKTGIPHRQTIFSNEPGHIPETHDNLQGIEIGKISPHLQQYTDGAMLSHGGVARKQLIFDWTRYTGENTSSEHSLVELHEARTQFHNQSHNAYASSPKPWMPVVPEDLVIDISRQDMCISNNSESSQNSGDLARNGQSIATPNGLNGIPAISPAPSNTPGVSKANETCNQRTKKRKAGDDDSDHPDRQGSPSNQTKRQKVIDHASQVETPPSSSSSSVATTTRRYRLLKPKRASTPILYAVRRINRTPAPPPTASMIHLANPWSNETVTRENMEYPSQITPDAVLLIDPWKRRTGYMECPPQVTSDAVLLIDPWLKRTETTADLGYKSPPTPSDAVLLTDPWKHRKDTVAGMESHQPPTVAEHPLYGGQWIGSDELNRTGSGKTWLPIQNTYLKPTFALGGLW